MKGTGAPQAFNAAGAQAQAAGQAQAQTQPPQPSAFGGSLGGQAGAGVGQAAGGAMQRMMAQVQAMRGGQSSSRGAPRFGGGGMAPRQAPNMGMMPSRQRPRFR